MNLTYIKMINIIIHSSGIMKLGNYSPKVQTIQSDFLIILYKRKANEITVPKNINNYTNYYYKYKC